MLENSETISRFEQAASTKDVAQREAQLAQLTQQLPDCNRTLLAWVILHLDHVTVRVRSKYHQLDASNIYRTKLRTEIYAIYNHFYHVKI